MINPVLRSLDLHWHLPGIKALASIDVLLFIILNEADIVLTTIALYLGSREMNFILASLESPFLMAGAKALFCITIITLLLGFKCNNLFKYLNIGLTLVVLWNLVAVISWL